MFSLKYLMHKQLSRLHREQKEETGIMAQREKFEFGVFLNY
jgi:hypothetical protein